MSNVDFGGWHIFVLARMRGPRSADFSPQDRDREGNVRSTWTLDRGHAPVLFGTSSANAGFEFIEARPAGEFGRAQNKPAAK